MMKSLRVVTMSMSFSLASVVSQGDVILPNLAYPMVKTVEHNGNSTSVFLNDDNYPDNGCGTGCIFQKYNNRGFASSSEFWLYRANIDSVYIPNKISVYPSIYYTVDSCLYGSNEYIGYKDSMDVRGNRQMSTYPSGYWLSFKSKKLLVYTGFNLFGKRIPPTALYLTTDVYNFDNYWYFSSGDTIWNDAKHYGIPTSLSSLIDSLRADSIRLANTPILTKPLSNHEPMELWSLSGENLWSGRDWRKSGLPTGVYLLKNRDAQRVVWVE